MAPPLDKPESTTNALHSPWLSDAAAEAYARKPGNDGGGGHDWVKLAGIGLLVGAGAAIVAYGGRRLGPLAEALRGGEPAIAAAQEPGAISEELLARLRGIDHFVFDMDRTLVDYDGAAAVLKKTMTDGLVQHSGLDREFITNALSETTQRLDSPYFWNRLDEIRPLQEKFPGVDLNAKFAPVAQASQAAYRDALKAKPETLELLQYLRGQGKSIHVFTAGSPARALEKLNGAGVLPYIDSIYTSGLNAFEDSPASGLLSKETASTPIIALEKTAKADGSGYHRILNDLRSRGSQVAMTGDHPLEDVANSKAHGMFASQATWYRSSPVGAVAPDLQLRSPAQLTAMLKSAYLPGKVS